MPYTTEMTVASYGMIMRNIKPAKGEVLARTKALRATTGFVANDFNLCASNLEGHDEQGWAGGSQTLWSHGCQTPGQMTVNSLRD